MPAKVEDSALVAYGGGEWIWAVSRSGATLMRILVTGSSIALSLLAGCATARSPQSLLAEMVPPAEARPVSSDEGAREPRRTSARDASMEHAMRQLRADYDDAFRDGGVVLVNLSPEATGDWRVQYVLQPSSTSDRHPIGINGDCELTVYRSTCAIVMPPSYEDIYLTLMPLYASQPRRPFTGRIFVRRGQAAPTEYRLGDYDARRGASAMAPVSAPSTEVPRASR